MAYRSVEFSELCGDCRAPADQCCPRCGSPLCENHTVDGETRCFGCELGYLERETRATRSVAISLVVLGALVGVYGALAAHAARNHAIESESAEWVLLIVPLSVFILAAAFVAPALIARLMRRRFLADRKPAERKPADCQSG